MEMADGIVAVKDLVSALGMNSRFQLAKVTARVRTAAVTTSAVRTTKHRFCEAKIWIPMLNYSAGLPDSHKETLRAASSMFSGTFI